MKLRTFTSALALTAALFATSALTLPAAAQDATTISGGFDVGPGGLQGNFNPLAATSGFTWLSTYFEPLVIYNADLTEVVGRSRRVLRDQRRPADLHLQAGRRQMARRRALHRRGREVHHRPRQERQDRLGLRRPPRRHRLGGDARRAHRRHHPQRADGEHDRHAHQADDAARARAQQRSRPRSSPRTPGGRPRRSAPARSSSSSTPPTSTSSSPPTPTTAAARPRSSG